MEDKGLYYYELYGLKARSNIYFPQLLPSNEISDDKVDIEITMTNGSEHSRPFEEIYKEGNSFGNTEHGLWFKNQAGKFSVETEGGVARISCEKYCDIHESIIRSFFMGNCIAMALTQLGKVALHGSSLIYKGRTIIVCGGSGAGKSTITTALINKGATLMSDDISSISIEDGICYTYSGFPEQKLCRDAAVSNGFDLDALRYVNEDSDKFSVDRNDIFYYGKKKVDTLFFIGKDNFEDITGFEEGVRVREITGADKVNAVTDVLFLKQMYGFMWGFSPVEMMRCVALAGQISIFRLTRKSGMDTVNRMVEAIEGNMQ